MGLPRGAVAHAWNQHRDLHLVSPARLAAETPILNLLVGAIAGMVAGALMVILRRRRRGPRSMPVSVGEGPPLLEWIMRANHGLGAWMIGPGSREAAVSRPGFSEEIDQAVRARVEHQRVGDSQGVVRLGGGTLVYASLDGRAAALLLEAGSSTGARAMALRDLARLLDYDRWRPVLADVARQQDTPGESVDSVAIRLAHQLERALGVEVCVAVPHATGVKVSGVALRSDRRLLGALVEPGSAMEEVALGRSPVLTGVPYPMGRITTDRRRGEEPAFVCSLLAGSDAVGAVAVWTPGGREPTDQMLADFRRGIEVGGPRLQAAIERRALAEAALRDPLTGLLNRAGLQDAMGLISTSAAALIYADLDHFKALNDELGHPAGDSALVHVSRLLLRAVRTQDSVARIGGEEFAIWLPGAPLERGRQVAERIRQALSWSDWGWEGTRRRLSASFGVAAWPETAATRDGLSAQADSALYAAKGQGRDRVAITPLSQIHENQRE